LGNTQTYDHGILRELNATPEIKKPGATKRFDDSTVDKYKQAMSAFYGNNSKRE
jgi:hypothetical protein